MAKKLDTPKPVAAKPPKAAAKAAKAAPTEVRHYTVTGSMISDTKGAQWVLDEKITSIDIGSREAEDRFVNLNVIRLDKVVQTS